jgi:hypothetical protein
MLATLAPCLESQVLKLRLVLLLLDPNDISMLVVADTAAACHALHASAQCALRCAVLKQRNT